MKPEFLPAALQIQEAPPSPLGRTLLWLLLGLFVLGLAWAILGRVDIVVTASGRVVPSDRVKSIQPAHNGTVSGILVVEGELVEQGQTLLQLDTTVIRTEIAQLRDKLADTQLEWRWRSALEQWFTTIGRSGTPFIMDATYDDSEQYEVLLLERISEISAEILSLEKELASIGSEIEANRAEKARVVAMLAILAERVEAYRILVDNQHGARIQYLEILQQYTDLQRSLPAVDAQQRQFNARANSLNSRISAFISKTRSDNLERLSDLQSEMSAFSYQLEKVLHIENEHTLRAPVTGTVEEMQTHTVGGVVKAGETVMKIVPEGVVVEVAALIENKDIGFVREGLDAEIKVETFNFTRYGIIPATVVDLSEDAVEDHNGAWKYRMRLVLEHQGIAIGQKELRLSPGMTATVEIKTGTRRIIEFLLSPLIRYGHESIRER